MLLIINNKWYSVISCTLDAICWLGKHSPRPGNFTEKTDDKSRFNLYLYLHLYLHLYHHLCLSLSASTTTLSLYLYLYLHSEILSFFAVILPNFVMQDSNVCPQSQFCMKTWHVIQNCLAQLTVGTLHGRFPTTSICLICLKISEFSCLIYWKNSFLYLLI